MNKFEILSDIIKKRQSIFPNAFTGEVISKDVIMSILENANQAPSHKHSEPWRYHVVSGNSKEAFADFMQSSYKAYVDEDKFKLLKYNKIRKKILLSSHIIMLGCHVDPSYALPLWEEMAAVSCAAQNIYLSLTALGLGGYWSSPSFLIENAQHFFEMSEYETSMGLFYVGVPIEVVPPKPVKGDLSQRVSWYL